MIGFSLCGSSCWWSWRAARSSLPSSVGRFLVSSVLQSHSSAAMSSSSSWSSWDLAATSLSYCVGSCWMSQFDRQERTPLRPSGWERGVPCADCPCCWILTSAWLNLLTASTFDNGQFLHVSRLMGQMFRRLYSRVCLAYDCYRTYRWARTSPSLSFQTYRADAEVEAWCTMLRHFHRYGFYWILSCASCLENELECDARCVTEDALDGLMRMSLTGYHFCVVDADFESHDS